MYDVIFEGAVYESCYYCQLLHDYCCELYSYQCDFNF